MRTYMRTLNSCVGPHLAAVAGLCAVLVPGAAAQTGVQTAAPREQHVFEKEEACPVLSPYAELDAFREVLLPRSVYEEARNQSQYECRHIWYRSDGLSVSGYLFRPKAPEGRQWPVILYNRGGTGDFGLIDDLTRVEFYLLVREGLVLATEYRSVGDRGRRDDWGGAMSTTCSTLVNLARSLSYIDARRMFMLGVSRGGMMTYLALKRGAPVRAAAVIAGPTDLEALAAVRPDFVIGDSTYDGWHTGWPDYGQRKQEYFRARSAVGFGRPDQHARADPPQPHGQQGARDPGAGAGGQAAAGQEGIRTRHYGKDGHSLPLNRTDRNQHIIQWFQAHDSLPGVHQ